MDLTVLSPDKLPHTHYCERGDSDLLLSEPINAFTNFSFLFLGYFAYKKLVDSKAKNNLLLKLPYLLALIGIGSFVYHTARNSFILLLDAVPIYIFILCCLYLAINNLISNSKKTLLIVFSFVVFQVILSVIVPREFLNGSIRHFANILFILVLSFAIYKKFGKKIVKNIIPVILFYALAIIFRSVDIEACNLIPLGTHFLWHIFASVAGYYAIDFLAEMYKSKK